MKVDWDLVKKLFHFEDEETVPLGWLVIIAITVLMAWLIYGPTFFYFGQ